MTLLSKNPVDVTLYSRKQASLFHCYTYNKNKNSRNGIKTTAFKYQNNKRKLVKAIKK